MTHRDHIRIVRGLIGDAALKATKTAYGRELKLIKQLTAKGRYDDLAFWDDLHFGFKLESICWLKTEEGANVLEQEWRRYQYARAESDRIAENALDTILNPARLDENESVEPPPLAKKLTPIDWADSTD